MASHPAWKVTGRFAAVGAGAASLLLVMLVAGGGARVPELPLDTPAARLAGLLRERDTLARRVSELEAQLRDRSPVSLPPQSIPPTVLDRWIEPHRDADAASRLLCARIAQVERDVGNDANVLVWDVCGGFTLSDLDRETTTAPGSPFGGGLFGCWVGAAPGAPMPDCLPLETAPRFGAVSAFAAR